MATVVHPSSALEHFLQLAQQGRHHYGSGGEKSAHKLAKCIVDNVPSLDETALVGLIEFVQIAKSHPTTSCDLLSGR